MSARDWLLLLALSLLWGMSFMFVEVILRDDIPPATLVMFRVGGAAVFTGALLKLRGVRLRAVLARWRIYIWMGLLGNAFPFWCFAWGQRFIDSGMAGVLNSTTPLFTVMMAAAAGMERLRGWRIFGVVLGACGVAVLLGPSGGGADAKAAAGILACVAAAASYGVVAILGKKKVTGFAPMENAFGQLTCATLILIPISFWLESPLDLRISAAGGAALAALSLFSTALAYIAYFRLLASAGPTNAMLVTFLIPVNATALGVLVLDERFGAAFFAGAGMILAGLIFADEKLQRKIFSAFRRR